MKEGLVSFKGINGGIYIHVKGGEYSSILEELERKLLESLDFFKGAKIAGIKGDSISREEKKELLNIMKYKYDLNVTEDFKEDPLDRPNMFEGIVEGMTKFIHNTIRSGQVIEYDGNIVVIGDVNPGALVRAKGNIVILGRLKGVAHAGCDGNTKALVAAYDLRPTQLRIGNIISRRPDENMDTTGLPEVAKVHDNEVVIEPYLPRK
ncbi:MAG TPA: septum site-determining protein MinC [Tissierellia bacterium]|nr:septum site-determining protein MinC [Tissierellia bacterium]